MTADEVRELLEARIDALDRLVQTQFSAASGRVELALTASKEAVTKAETAQEKRLDLLNEFRGQASDEAKKYPTRELVDAHFSAIEERLGKVETAVASFAGRALALTAVGAIIGFVVSLVAGLLM